jgi:hypothetical protein
MFGNQMLTSTVEEKENRVIEMILTTVKTKTLIVGKILALITLAFLQGILVIAPALLAYFIFKDSLSLPAIDLSGIPFDWYRITAAILIFISSFLFFTGLLVAIGAASPTAKEAGGFIGVVMMLLFGPLYAASLFISSPESPFVQFMTLFPLTAPIPALLRNAVGNLSQVETILVIVILAISAYVTMIIAVAGDFVGWGLDRRSAAGVFTFDDRLPKIGEMLNGQVSNQFLDITQHMIVTLAKVVGHILGCGDGTTSDDGNNWGIFGIGFEVLQTYRNAFGLKKSKSIDWLKLNVSLAKRFFGKQGRWAIAIDPSYISKAGKKTPHIGRFWSGCAQSVKHGLEIMGIGLIDIDAKDCMMLKAHQSLSNKELSLRNKTMVDFYIGVIKRYRKELLKLSTLIVADAYFSTSTFVNGIKKEGFSLISRFRDNACLFYVYAGPRTGKRGRPKTKDGKIDMKNLDLTRMEKMEMKDIEGTAYTLIAYSKALRCKVRLVIWQMPNGKKKLFFSTDTSLSGEEVLLYYRTRFQIEFCFRDAKGYTGLMDCQARDKWKLDFAFNASFTSLNVAKVTMKEMGMEYSMSSFKSLMTNIYLVKRIFKASGYTPNRTLISKIFKDLSCLQRIAA